jgi:predicted nuclease of predicted toxin-antitoxin system
MKFLIDENIDFRFAKKLQKQGHGVTRLSKGMADREVLLKAQKEKSIFLTMTMILLIASHIIQKTTSE